MDGFSDLQRKIDQSMLGDRHRASNMLRDIQSAKKAGRPWDQRLARLHRMLDQSIARRQRRRDRVPKINYDLSLPVSLMRHQIAQAIADHQVVVVCGETGSGKSTQLPKICLELGRGISGMIGHTQPRRVAARSVASRIAEELGTSLGDLVGFKIRFTDETRDQTLIKLMTDGIMLAETQHDRFLQAYDTIIIDEAHERSLNIDFLLGYVHRLLPRRPDLRLIITSATIDAQRFATHFSVGRDVPVVEVSGRTYPVEIRYQPWIAQEDGEEPDVARQVADAVEQLMDQGPGDVLVFLPTERDIRDVSKVLRGRLHSARKGTVEILPLYARLSLGEQNRVFQQHRGRRIVLATNVAESSLTVPNIRYVVDTGTARISRYSPRSKIQRLPIEPVSRASADQRAGRCGRIGPGICVRLYSQDDYLGRDQYTTPEIRRTNLAAVILQTLAMKLGRIDEFPFVDPPRPETIRDGYRTLRELGAIDSAWQPTEIGRQLAVLPVDPRIGRMILAAHDENCLREVLIIAAALEVQDPRERPLDRQEAADQAHARLADPDSDFLTYLKLWDFFHGLKGQLSGNQLRKACRQNFLSFNRLREWLEVHRQLVRLVEASGMKQTARRDDPQAIHRALLPGLLSNIALRIDRHQYQGAGGAGFHLWPGSVLFAKKPQWIVAAELVETNRRYLRTVGGIDPAWIEPLAEHLVKRNYSDPHWSARQGTVLAHEKVTLFGLPIVSGRRVTYGAIDPVVSREIFLRDGLVAGNLESRFEFYQHNRQLVEEIHSTGAKARRRDYLIEEHVCYCFYDARIPQQVHDVATLRGWLNQASQNEKDGLRMRASDLLPGDAEPLDATGFPDHLQIDRTQCRFEYRFQPGADDDGVTLHVPPETVNRLSEDQLGWLVPGLLEAKVTALIRSLPKSLRRGLVPAPDTARKAVTLLSFGQGAFLPALAEVLSQIGGEPIGVDDFDLERLEPHLKMNVRVIDQAGEPVAQGRDLVALRQQAGIPQGTPVASIDAGPWNQDGLVHWSFGDLPEHIELRRGAFVVAAYPALIDAGTSVSLRLLDSQHQAERQTRAGLRRLFCLAEQRQLRTQVKWLPDLNRLQMYASTLRHATGLTDQLLELMADRAFLDQDSLPRSEAEFLAAVQRGRRRIPLAAQDVAQLITPLMNGLHQVQVRLENSNRRWQETFDDVRRQLSELFPEGYLVQTPWNWLEQYPRYLSAIMARLDKLSDARGSGDWAAMQSLRAMWQAYTERREQLAAQGRSDEQLETYRWMIEEYRVSLFAQSLGTAIKISPQRLEKQWRLVR